MAVREYRCGSGAKIGDTVLYQPPDAREPKECLTLDIGYGDALVVTKANIRLGRQPLCWMRLVRRMGEPVPPVDSDSEVAELRQIVERSQAAHRGFFELYDHEALPPHCRMLFRIVADQQRAALIEQVEAAPVDGVIVPGFGRGL